MNYIWELLIHAKNQQLSLEQLHFRFPKRFSPYMELSFADINAQSIGTEIEVNPYFRFYTIFASLCADDMAEMTTVKEQLFDVLIHFLGYVDCLKGMSKREYYVRHVIAEITNGVYGTKIKAAFAVCQPDQQAIIANRLIQYYRLGEGVFVYKMALKQLFPKSYIFANAKEKDELVVYLCEHQTKAKVQIMALLQELFIPFQFRVEVYWDYIFGVMELDATMKLDEMLIY